MDKLYLITTNDALEAYLVEAILKKNKIECKIEIIKTDGKRKYSDGPDKANVFVDKEKYEQALKLIDVIKKEREIAEEKEEEYKLFTKKQLFFAISTTVLFLFIIIWIVIYSFK